MKKTDHLPTLVFAVLLSMSSGLAQAISPTDPIQKNEKEALFPAMSVINFGRDVAVTACVSCHGLDGISDAPGKPHLAGQRAIYLYRVQLAFQAGTRADKDKNHKAFLTDESLLAVSAYYASLAPAPNYEAQDASGNDGESEEDPFIGIRNSVKKCIKCHGETGNAEGSGMPNLTAQDPEYFVTSMNSYTDGSRKHNLMKRLVSALDEATIKEMGVYYAVQEPLRTETQGDGDAGNGERLAEDCESCHGDDGNSKKAKMPTLAGQDARYFIKAMKHYKDGKRQHQKMFEAVEQLSEQEIIDLATYYAAQQPLKRNVRAPLKSTEWITRCERCHGVGGNSSDARFPMLAGQDKDYLIKALKDSADEGDSNSTMHRMADSLSSRDIERLAAYFSSQQPKAVVYIQLPCSEEK
ncbi:MAG: c-type cytochrome [Xanthomonadales bacterium]|nr:c-type cytochrome [Xanthomonadales bacterium]MDH4019787.1 c-type cytochrome [Xanthomonadales bacterium]